MGIDHDSERDTVTPGEITLPEVADEPEAETVEPSEMTQPEITEPEPAEAPGGETVPAPAAPDEPEPRKRAR